MYFNINFTAIYESSTKTVRSIYTYVLCLLHAWCSCSKMHTYVCITCTFICTIAGTYVPCLYSINMQYACIIMFTLHVVTFRSSTYTTVSLLHLIQRWISSTTSDIICTCIISNHRYKLYHMYV